MSSIHHIANDLGQRRIAAALGVNPTAVNNAVSRGAFPSSWYFVVRDLCGQAGIECPRDIFNFKSPATAPSQEAS